MANDGCRCMAIGLNMKKQIRSRKTGDRGFSLIELMFAMGVLAIAIMGSMAMVVIGIGRNSSTRMDTTATNVAQTVLEDIATALPNAAPGTAVNIVDCANNNLTITTDPGGPIPDPNGDINFQNPAPVGYEVNYTMCSGTANTVTAIYDVRWRIDAVGPYAKLVTVAARQPMAISKGKLVYIPPVTLRTVVGM